MVNLLAAVLGGSHLKTHRLNNVSLRKLLRSPELVERLKRDAEIKRFRKNQKRDFDNAACKLRNPCFQVGKPSQKFFKYIPRPNAPAFMVPVHE